MILLLITLKQVVLFLICLLSISLTIYILFQVSHDPQEDQEGRTSEDARYDPDEFWND